MGINAIDFDLKPLPVRQTGKHLLCSYSDLTATLHRAWMAAGIEMSECRADDADTEIDTARTVG